MTQRLKTRRLLRLKIRHDGFPKDGAAYWLRWVDVVDPIGGGTGSPRTQAILSRLPAAIPDAELPSLEEALSHDGPEVTDCIALAFAGDIPALCPGLVIRDGVRVGCIAMERRTFRFGLGAVASKPTACSDRSPAMPPSSWGLDIPWTVLPQAAYPLPERWRNARCVTIHEEGRQLVLPCMEVFRYFYAADSLSANVLLGGPFALRKGLLINPAHTRVRDDGSWQVGLRTGFTGDDASRLGNLALSPFGHDAANRLFRTLPFTARISAGAGHGMLEAAVPYDWTEMEISVRGLQLYPAMKASGGLDKFLGLAIESVAWPVLPAGLPAAISFRLDNNNAEGGSGQPVAPPTPGGAVERPVAGLDGSIKGSAFVPPSLGSAATFVEVPYAAPKGGPELTRMPLEDAEGPTLHPVIGEPEDVDVVSTATALPGPTGAAKLRYIPGKGPEPERRSARFVVLMTALKGLRAASKIDGWEVVRPPTTAAVRDGVDAWAFPLRSSTGGALPWSSPRQLSGAPRAALVLDIRLSGHVVTWVETELLGSEDGCHSLVFLGDGTGVKAVIPRLLLAVAAKSGSWKAAAVLGTSRGVVDAKMVRHGAARAPFGDSLLERALRSVMPETK